MRTTLTIADDLMQQLKDVAYRRDVPLRQIIEQALRLGLQHLDEPSRRRRHYRCPTFAMGLPRSTNIDLDKALALAESLDDEAAVRKSTSRR